MSIHTKVPDAIDYLVETFTAADTLGAANPPVVVRDGPAVTMDWAQLALWVGAEDPDSNGMITAAESSQTWASLGARARDELFSVYCTAEAWDGGSDVKTVRTAAFGIVSAAEELLVADADLGGNILVLLDGPTGYTWRQANTDKGAVCQVTFRIDCKARLTTT